MWLFISTAFSIPQDDNASVGSFCKGADRVTCRGVTCAHSRSWRQVCAPDPWQDSLWMLRCCALHCFRRSRRTSSCSTIAYGCGYCRGHGFVARSSSQVLSTYPIRGFTGARTASSTRSPGFVWRGSAGSTLRTVCLDEYILINLNYIS